MSVADPDLLRRTAELAVEHLARIGEGPAGPRRGVAELRERLPAALPEEGLGGEEVVEELVRSLDEGLTASPGGRYFGFVTGGALPAALAADWLTSTWDQNSFAAVSS